MCSSTVNKVGFVFIKSQTNYKTFLIKHTVPSSVEESPISWFCIVVSDTTEHNDIMT